MGRMNIPGWSIFLIVPGIIVGSGIPVIRRSETPWTLALIVVGMSLAVSAAAWGVLQVLDKRQSQ